MKVVAKPLSLLFFEKGSLLKLNKSIYGTNDAARAWYLALREILTHIELAPFTFETAAFILRDANNILIAILVFHVDDFLMGWTFEHPQCQEYIQKLKNAVT